MKATLEFKLPDEEQEHLDAIHGTDWKLVVWRFREHMSRMRKDDLMPTLDALIEDLNAEIDCHNLNLD
jgi:hypothetical protein